MSYASGPKNPVLRYDAMTLDLKIGTSCVSRKKTYRILDCDINEKRKTSYDEISAFRVKPSSTRYSIECVHRFYINEIPSAYRYMNW